MQARNVHQSGNNGKRYAAYLAVLCVVALLAGILLIGPFRASEKPIPLINPVPPADGGLAYPYSLVPGNPVLDFPAAEGRLADMDSDTWFLEGVLEGTGDRSTVFLYRRVLRQPHRWFVSIQLLLPDFLRPG